MTSVTLAANSGSVENLNVSARHGCTPNARQARTTVAWSIFNRTASSRDDQCVTPNDSGGGRNVSAMIQQHERVTPRSNS